MELEQKGNNCAKNKEGREGHFAFHPMAFGKNQKQKPDDRSRPKSNHYSREHSRDAQEISEAQGKLGITQAHPSAAGEKPNQSKGKRNHDPGKKPPKIRPVGINPGGGENENPQKSKQAENKNQQIGNNFVLDVVSRDHDQKREHQGVVGVKSRKVKRRGKK